MAGGTLAVNDVVELRSYCTVGAQTSINVSHFAVTFVGGVSLDVSDVLPTIEAPVASAFRALISQDVTYVGSSLQKVAPTRFPYQSTIANQGLGTVLSPVMPRQACGLFSKVTAFVGQANRGRTYVPFPGSADDDVDGFPTTGYMVRLGVLAAALTNVYVTTIGADSVTVQGIVYHRSSPSTITIIRSLVARQAWATQKRRGSFGKFNSPPI